MQNRVVTRRTQFSSCDECRRSRVACDSQSRRSAAGKASAPCTRCRNRDRDCTFKWIQDARAGPSTRHAATPPKASGRHKRDARLLLDQILVEESATAPTPETSPIHSYGSTQNSRHESLEEALPEQVSASPDSETHPLRNSRSELEWLQTLYRQNFEVVFGSWMGRYSCPYLFGQNDLAERYMAETSKGNQGSSHEQSTQQDKKRDDLIGQSLRNTIAAFAVRWLPITSSDGLDNSHRIQTMWRQARRDMLRIINRPSYRSMLSLFLFALTPIPMGISEDEEADGVSGQVCIHAAMQMVQTLRARHRNLQFSGSKVTPSSSSIPMSTTPESADTSSFINAENIAYWAAITFDTSASLTLNCRPLLSSGLFGFESEFTWKLVRTCLNVFNESSKSWCQGSAEMTDERANEIIAAAACWKLMGWKLAANFKEALRDGHDESEVRKALSYVSNSWKEFDATFRPFLDECYKRMQFLAQQTKLRWFSLMLHSHLSILMVLDTIEVADRYDLLADLKDASIEAENTVMNALAFGLHNTMTLRRSIDSPSPGLSHERTARNITFTVPLLAIDPYPHHIVASVQLMRKAIDRDYKNKKVTQDLYDSLNSTLESALKHLPQSSKSIQAARQKFSAAPDDEILDTQIAYRELPALLHG
ncbi:hypothetical protein TGAM01_v202072 [Trichoderma gamsii]|uniref:Zn(2)-C6 fungal-type domain-containing protein n=1 Tax=Trichoderma gamsii TaxID=398673 RepID=A0A2P4ZXE5_9HYPO|nr:hypothetical protein TGAM01_v202072 [Trichoderma gamsii]PON28964.1 hypothetical protein TGAM01_v202072 [Trichoderma gamsii]